MISVKFALSVTSAAAVMLLSGCASPEMNRKIEQAQSKVPMAAIPGHLQAGAQTLGAPDAVAQRGVQFHSDSLVRSSSAPWVGGLRSVPRTEDRLPAVFNEKYQFSFADRSALPTVAERLTRMTGVPVRIRDDVFASAMTASGERVEVMLNIDDPAAVSDDVLNAADGVGLFRTEFQFLVSATLPQRERQTRLYRDVLEAAGDKPVIFRTVDIGGDKSLPYLREDGPGEENPAMGWRALRVALDANPSTGADWQRRDAFGAVLATMGMVGHGWHS